MASHRNLIFIWCVCITLIGIAAGVRIERVLSEQKIAYSKQPISTNNNESLNTDELFYEQENSTGTNSKPESTNTSSVISSTQNPVSTASLETDIISARAYLAGNISTKEIYLKKNAKMILPVASMSKLITAFVVTDMLSSSTKITITPEEVLQVDVASDTSKLTAGESFDLNELLYPLLMNSSNIAAEALASSSNRMAFLDSMTGYAWEVGMPNTLFADPSGLSSRNVSTANDFFVLAQYLYKSRTDILTITKTITTKVSSTTEHDAHDFANIHPFVRDPNFLGGKTGHTPEAKDTMLTIMKINGKPVAIIVIASDDRRKDTALIIEKVKKEMGN